MGDIPTSSQPPLCACMRRLQRYTSSYILCHIIIHTMSHHHTYYVNCGFYVNSKWEFFKFWKKVWFFFIFCFENSNCYKIFGFQPNKNFRIPCLYYPYGIIQGNFHNFDTHIRVSKAIKSGRAYCDPPWVLKVAKMPRQIRLISYKTSKLSKVHDREKSLIGTSSDE